MNARRLLVIPLIVLALASCSRSEVLTRQYLTFGTLVDVSIATDDPARAEQAFDALAADFNQMQTNWNAWKPGSLLRVNQLLPLGEAFTTSPQIVELITRAQPISRASGYLFNPAIGKLIALWGFHQDDPGPTTPDKTDAIQALVAAHPTLDDIEVHGVTLRSRNPDVQLDFGGFAKGYALKLASEHLLDLGLRDFIINAGGDLVARGRHLDRPWRIGVRDPDDEDAVAAIEVRDGEGAFTSGDYERYYMEDGQRRHHIIDPRTGYPSTGARAVTVIHDDPALADAAATALTIAHDDEWLAIAQRLGVDKVLRMNASGDVIMTDAMQQRISALRPDLKVTVVHWKSGTSAL